MSYSQFIIPTNQSHNLQVNQPKLITIFLKNRFTKITWKGHHKHLLHPYNNLNLMLSDNNLFHQYQLLHLRRDSTAHVPPAKFLRFAIDDGTGCIPCILWLNHMTSPHLARRRSPQDLCLLADAASRSAAMVKVGVVARVRGKVSGFKGGVQITVTDVFVERDPNAEILHWVECVNLAKNCYNLVNVPSSSSSSSGSVMRK